MIDLSQKRLMLEAYKAFIDKGYKLVTKKDDAKERKIELGIENNKLRRCKTI